MTDREPPQPSIDDQLRGMSPPAWIEDMRRQAQEHGWYRPEDLRRLLGDPSQGVTIGLDGTVPESFFNAART